MQSSKRARIATPGMVEFDLGDQQKMLACTDTAASRLADNGPEPNPVLTTLKSKHQRLRFMAKQRFYVHLSLDVIIEEGTGPPYTVTFVTNILQDTSMSNHTLQENTDHITHDSAMPPVALHGGDGDEWPASWLAFMHGVVVGVVKLNIKVGNAQWNTLDLGYVRKLFTARGVDGNDDAGSCIIGICGVMDVQDDIVVPEDLNMTAFDKPHTFINNDTIDRAAVRAGRARITGADVPGYRAIAGLSNTHCLDWKPTWEGMIVADLARR